MKKRLILLLKKAGWYYSLQGMYRGGLRSWKRWRLRARYASHKGNRYTCKFCNGSYNQFAPWDPAPENRVALEANEVIAGYGKNILCPNCLSTARERLVRAVLEKEPIAAGARILHAAPEKHLYEFLKTQASVTTIDYLPAYYRRIDPNIAFADLRNLSFGDAQFDYVIANHVLEHIPEDKQAIREIFRVLKTGGKAIRQVPFSNRLASTLEEPGIHDPARQSALFGQADHVRVYAREDFMQRLRSAGFTVDYLAYEEMNDLHQYAIQPGEGFFKISK